MPFFRGISLAVLGSFCLALLITLLPTAQISRQDVFAWAAQPVRHVSQNNISDLITSLPEQQNIRRVTWNEGQLSLDMVLTESLPSQEGVYRQMFYLLQTLFTQTRNVHEVFLRIFYESDGERQLLASLIASRDILQKDPEMGNQKGLDLNLYLSHYFHFSKTPYWFRLLPQSNL